MNFKKVILLTSLLLLVLACGNSPETAVTGVLNAMKGGDVQKLCEYWPQIEDEIGDLPASEVEEQFPAMPDMTWNILTTELSFNGESATVEVEIYLNADTVTKEFLCVLLQDKWVVDDMVSVVSAYVHRNTCRANMRVLASREVIYYADNNEYTNSIQELSMDGMVCPECKEDYEFVVRENGTEFYITCPCGHGSIDNGVPSWDDPNDE